MRVTIVAGGSRGDVQPLVPLALGIQAAGHEVTIAASIDSERLVSDYDLRFHPFAVSISDQMRTDAGRAWIIDSVGRPFREFRHIQQVYAETARPLGEALLDLAGSADLFVSGLLTIDAMASIAAHDGVGHATALLSPIHPTADGRSGITSPNSRKGIAHLTRTRVSRRMVAGTFAQAGRVVREHLGTPETGAKGFVRALDTTTAALGVSSVLVPNPPDWPRSVTVTGPWTLAEPQGWQPPSDLVDFLAAGSLPVYLGFGSMSVVQPERIRTIATTAARAAGLRLVLSGTDLSGPDGDDVFGVSDVPHTWLLPRTRGVMHHGGAGTTHAALLAGVPQLAVPHIADQPYWGRRVHEEGLGPAPLPLNKLTADALAERLRLLVGTAPFTARAADLGERARTEDGVSAAVEQLLTPTR